MKIKTRAVAPRAARVAPATFSEETRSFECVWATDAPCPIEVWDSEKGWVIADEILSMEAGHVRSERMSSGLPLLDNHQRWSGQMGQYGKVRENRIEGGQCVGRAFLSSRPELAGLVQDVRDGIADTFSVGYRVHGYEITKRDGQRTVYKAIDWEPLEVSFAPVQADIGAKARSADEKEERSCEAVIVGETEEPTSTPEPVPEPIIEEERKMELTREQMNKLMARAASLSLSTEMVEAIFAAGAERSYEDLTDDLLKAAKERKVIEDKERKDKAPDPERPTPSTQVRIASITEDQAEKEGAGIIEYIEHRANGSPLGANGARFLGMNMFDLCRKVLQDTGRNPIGNRYEIVREALTPTRQVRRSQAGVDRERDITGIHTTSDFGDLLGDGVLRRKLLASYNATADNFSSFVGTTTFTDPRTQKFIRLGGFSSLPEVKEGAEYKRKTLGEESEDIDITKRGAIIGLSLEAILRDDLSAFTRLPAQLGRAAKKTEAVVVFSLLGMNSGNGPTMSDGLTLFHATHGNVGSASAPDIVGLTDARTLMRKQKDIGLSGTAEGKGNRLGITPAVVLLPNKYELGVAQIMGPDQARQNATESTDIVPGYIRDMKYLVSEVLDEYSTQIWYAFANPSEAESIVIARLEGNQPFEIMSRTGWEVDGVEWKIRHWFGAGAVDWRGSYKNAGV